MSIIYKNSQIPELYAVRHKHDELPKEDISFDYTMNLYKKSISPFILLNPKMREFTNYLSKIMSLMIDSGMELKNMFYFTHDKFYNKDGK